MSSLFHEIENNEALLLLYLANELPIEDRIEVEQMLSSDGGLRMELEEVRSAMADAMAVVAQLDSLEPVSASACAIAVRSVGREMKQWHVDRLRAQPVKPMKKGLRYPGWVYPTAAVASVLLGALVWWGISGISTTDIPGNQMQTTVAETSDQKIHRLENSFVNDSSGLNDAETQASSLIARTDDPTASIFLSETAQEANP